MSPLTSSTSNSNWNGKNSFDPNEETLQNSNYLIKDRVSASLTWSKAFVGAYRTSVGVFYEGRRGKPYSWTYINDMNGDAIGGNDLMYIPSGPGANEVIFRGGATEEARFWDIVNANSALAAAKGGVVGRNNSFAPWVNNFDVRFSQEMPGFMKGHKTTFTLDFLNFGNLLNKKWGRIDEIRFPFEPQLRELQRPGRRALRLQPGFGGRLHHAPDHGRIAVGRAGHAALRVLSPRQHAQQGPSGPFFFGLPRAQVAAYARGR